MSGCARSKHCISKTTKAKRLNESTAHFLYAVLACVFDQRLYIFNQKQEIAKIPDWPRRKAVAEFRLCVGHDCLGTHLYRTGIHPDPYCMLCSLREPMDRNHLGQCTALLNRTECERYWEAWIKMMEN